MRFSQHSGKNLCTSIFAGRQMPANKSTAKNGFRMIAMVIESMRSI